MNIETKEDGKCVSAELHAIKLLLHHKADVSATNHLGLTAAGIAALYGKDQARKVFEDAGAVENGAGYRNVLLVAAAEKDDLRQVHELVQKGASVNARDERGFTVSMWVAYWGHHGLLEQLIEKGADVKARVWHGAAALPLACGPKSNLETVKLLLDNGANPNATTMDGTSVLMVAAETGDIERVQLLVDRGADVNARTNRGITAAMVAAENGHARVLDLLKKHEAK